MGWDLATARAAVGLAAGDTSKDVALQRVMDVVMAEAEGRLERGLLSRRVVERFHCVQRTPIFLTRYPVSAIHSPINAAEIHYREGWISGLCGDFSVDYTGGFEELPSDLEYALWGAFLTIWAAVDPVTGLPTLAGAALIQGSGDVKSLTVFDAYRVDYDVGTSSASSGSDDGRSAQANWGFLAPWATTLERYKRWASV